MLAGAYSKQYQTLEKEHLENLKSTTYNVKIDVLARAKKLSHETNKRRKAQAAKRKNEALREEKRRQEILAKRHEEQKSATERFQRSHVSHSRPTSSKSYKYSTSAIEDALKLVRGSPPISRQNNYTQHGGRTSSPLPAGNYPSDPLSRPYFNKHKSHQHRPSSPSSQTQVQDHAEMMDKSLRNWNDSKSLFEQQLEEHQQLLLDQQQRSLYEFNEAISNEIARDSKINGTEEREESPIRHSESLSSVDSLEDSLNVRNKQQVVEDDPNLLAHNLIYPVALSGGVKGGFYLETNHAHQTPSKSEIRGVSLRSTVPLSYSDLTVHNNVPETTLSYLSQPNSGIGTVPISTNGVKPVFVLSGNMLQANVTAINNPYQHSPDINDERPSAHVKTWVEPQKTEAVTYNTPANVSKGDYNNKMASTISTATTYNITTPQVKPRTVFNTNSANNVNNMCTTSETNSYVSTTSISRVYSDPVSQYYKNTDTHVTSSKLPNPSATSVVSTPLKTKTVDSVSNGTSHMSSGDRNNGNKNISGSILAGTLNLVEGKLTSTNDDKVKVQPKFPDTSTPQREAPPNTRTTNSNTTNVITRADSTENIVGILKKSPSTTSMRDSIEIARIHRQMSEEMKNRPKSGKKSVRFADLSDNEEDDILISSFSHHDTHTGMKINLKKPRARASSARYVSKMAKVPPSAAKPPRAVSAGTQRAVTSEITKPKAVAHIIQSHEPPQTEQAEIYYKNLQAELEKKVTLVNNNFMGKVVTTQQSPQYTTNGNLSTQAVTSKYQTNGTKAVHLKMTDATKQTTLPKNSASPPHASNVHYGQPVFDENGLRIDRTPTDDEINQLWETVRTCLHPNDEERSNCSQAQSDSVLLSRQAAQISSKVIDGGALGSIGPPTRVGSAYQPRTATKVYQARQTNQGTSNGYLKKYGLLQQRRQQEKVNSKINTAKTNNFMPQISQSNTSPTKKDDVSDSMAVFMMAEQLTSNRSIPESQIHHAMDDLQLRQNIANSNNNKVPSALSIEEQQLIESLDRLNEKLKTAENKHPQVNHTTGHQVSHQAANISSNSNQTTPGFRGRRPISNHQRRHTDGVRTDYLLRAASAYIPRQYR
ncbi:uncharacterized protein LOC126810692 isoform X2 [Patella vulgata]|uniref:uncharacterized protein LOC126810692 isoform X2 n=1 Tax=Patella vulgata TaxID=6465 RepID=UPI00218060A7|nr:uncharacterized protein LOC126810692 isoform X2 [Patella vulgata]